MAIMKAFDEAANQRGFGNEDRFCAAFTGNFSKPSWFEGVERGTKKNDARQIDAFVLTRDVGKIPFQIKSSWTGAKKFQRENSRRSKYIGVLVLRAGESPEKIRRITFGIAAKLRFQLLEQRFRPGEYS